MNGYRKKGACPHVIGKYKVKPNQIILTKSGEVCEKCYEPQKPNSLVERERKELEENEEYSQSEVISPGSSNSSNSPSPSSSSEDNSDLGYNYKDSIYIPDTLKITQQEISGTSKEIKVEDFFKGKTHNIKLNIPDAPHPFKPDFFRQTFNRWMILLTCPYLAKYIITDRGSGKSKNASLYLLYRLWTEKEAKPYPYLASFVMRNWDENTKMTRPQYERYLDGFAEFFFGAENNKDKKRFRLRWDALYRGIQLDEREVMPFIDLYNPAISRRNDTPNQEMFFEEAIPTKEQVLKDGGWITQGGKFVEDTNYSMIYKSASRGIVKSRMTFLGNPNIPWVDIWFLNQHWEEELTEISKWYWSNTPKGKDFGALKKWRRWSWIKIYQKEVEGLGVIFLYLEKMEHEPKLTRSEEDWCWHEFFTPAERLNIVPFVNGSEPLWVFNGCICFWREKTKEDPMNTGYWSFIEIENPRYPNRDTLFKNIYEVIINDKQDVQNVNSGLTDMVRRREKKDLQNWLNRQYRGGLLKFNSALARRKMLRFMEEGKIIT